ncbi:MAG: universal stress protein [Alphaproteobacteria bacterium]
MPIRKILVPLGGTERDALTLATTAVVARHLEAHMEALFVRPPPSEALPFMGEGIAGPVIQDILTAAREAADHAVSRSREQLEALSQNTGLPIIDAPRGPGAPTLSFAEETGPFADVVAARALLSDLVAFTAPRNDEGVGLSTAFQQCLMSSGRPIFLVPDNAPITHIGEAVTIGWDGSSEAAHAVHNAMPFLKTAKRIDVLNVTSGPKDTSLTDRLADYLTYHGLKSLEHVVDPEGRPTGDVLIEQARAMGSDMIVMGGYGHSRIRELIIGGATRHVLFHTAMPILLAH